jgi:hypothetical protein
MKCPKNEEVRTFAEKVRKFAEKARTFAEKVRKFAEGHFYKLRQHKHLRGVFFPDYPDYSDYPKGVGSREGRSASPPLSLRGSRPVCARPLLLHTSSSPGTIPFPIRRGAGEHEKTAKKTAKLPRDFDKPGEKTAVRSAVFRPLQELR